MNTVSQAIKTRLAQLATFPEKYNIGELASELQKLAVRLLEEEGEELPTLEESPDQVQIYRVRSPICEFTIMSTNQGIIDLVNLGYHIIP
jgi:hypothetical protein